MSRKILVIIESNRMRFLKMKKNAISYGLDNPSEVFALDVKNSRNGLTFVMNMFDEGDRVKTSLLGEYNVYNCLASAIVARFLGVKGKSIIS